ncbi:MAG: hypothetical protein KGI27_13755, partial [Thaumarchaeota archaeon]|nr:hypothetical protein [Nitrososphaerota archaeon]
AQSVRVVDFQSTGKQNYTNVAHVGNFRGSPSVVHTLTLGAGTQPLTLIEGGGVNTGTFVSWDGGKKSDIVTVDNPNIRGQSAVVRYNDISTSIVGGFSFASLTQVAQNNTWASGQRIPVTLTDNDDNKNGKISERMFLWDPTYKRSTAMVIGTPFTLSSGGVAAESANITGLATFTASVHGIVTVNLGHSSSNASSTNLQEDEAFSARPIFNFTNQTAGGLGQKTSINTGSVLLVDLKTTMNTLLKTIHNTNRTGNTEGFKGFNFLNYDLRSLSSLNGATGGSISNIGVYLVYNNAGTGLNKGGAQTAVSIANSTQLQDFINLNGTDATKVANPGLLNKNLFGNVAKTANIGLLFKFTTSGGNVVLSTSGEPIVADFFSVGLIGDGSQSAQRINNGIYRYELQETGDNTGVFTGTNQFVMLNQLNIFDPNTYANLRTINHDVFFPAIQDMLQSEARAPQITYLDLGQDGVNTQISAQQDIPTHTGVISFDSKTYKIGDTVTITLSDPDLNVNNDLVDIYTAVTPAFAKSGSIPQTAQDNATDTIGKSGLGQYSDGSAFGRLVDIQFGQANVRWSNSNIHSQFTPDNTGSCFKNSTGAFVDSNTGTTGGFATSLSATGFSLVETGPSTGIFTGTFEIPDQLCQSGSTISSVGQNIKVNYVDFRDSSGKLVEVSDNAGIRGNTGSVKLDKSVYPVPFGTLNVAGPGGANFDTSSDSGNIAKDASLNGVFPLHRDLSGSGLLAPLVKGGPQVSLTLPAGTVLVHARVNDPDYTTAATGTNFIATGVWDANHGPVAFQISRQGASLLLGTAGGPAKIPGHILDLNGTQLPPQNDPAWSKAADLGPMTEISPGAGIFQADLPIELTDGPAGTDCPAVTNWDQSINGTKSFTTAQTPNSNAGGTTASHQGGRFWTPAPSGSNYCVRQGDVLTVTYFDTSDASGQPQTVTDSATF